MDPELVAEFLESECRWADGELRNKATGRRIAAVLPVHLLGHPVDIDPVLAVARKYGLPVVEDASESLGATYKERPVGTLGDIACFSFNGNKTVTTGGGGMILTDDEALAGKARYLTTQAKDDPVRYIHHEIGYNFRLTNIQAALGIAQLEQLPKFLDKKQEIFREYRAALQDIEGLAIANAPDYARNNHWLNILQIDSEVFGEDREVIMQRLDDIGIQTRPVWTLNHLQKPYRGYQNYKIEKATELVKKSLCLPSSTNLSNGDINNILKMLTKDFV